MQIQYSVRKNILTLKFNMKRELKLNNIKLNLNLKGDKLNIMFSSFKCSINIPCTQFYLCLALSCGLSIRKRCVSVLKVRKYYLKTK